MYLVPSSKFFLAFVDCPSPWTDACFFWFCFVAKKPLGGSKGGGRKKKNNKMGGQKKGGWLKKEEEEKL